MPTVGWLFRHRHRRYARGKQLWRQSGKLVFIIINVWCEIGQLGIGLSNESNSWNFLLDHRYVLRPSGISWHRFLKKCLNFFQTAALFWRRRKHEMSMAEQCCSGSFPFVKLHVFFNTRQSSALPVWCQCKWQYFVIDLMEGHRTDLWGSYIECMQLSEARASRILTTPREAGGTII